MKRNLLTALVLAGVFGLLVLFAHPDYRQGEPSLSGTPAREFSFTLEGRPAHLSDLRGKVVVLNFWATWCPPCVEETAALNRMQQVIAPFGATVLGISVDEDPAAYDNFLREHQITFPNYRDPSRQISSSYGTSMFPETYIIDRQGRFVRKIVGPQAWDQPEMLAYLYSVFRSK